MVFPYSSNQVGSFDGSSNCINPSVINNVVSNTISFYRVSCSFNLGTNNYTGTFLGESASIEILCQRFATNESIPILETSFLPSGEYNQVVRTKPGFYIGVTTSEEQCYISRSIYSNSGSMALLPFVPLMYGNCHYNNTIQIKFDYNGFDMNELYLDSPFKDQSVSKLSKIICAKSLRFQSYSSALLEIRIDVLQFQRSVLYDEALNYAVKVANSQYYIRKNVVSNMSFLVRTIDQSKVNSSALSISLLEFNNRVYVGDLQVGADADIGKIYILGDLGARFSNVTRDTLVYSVYNDSSNFFQRRKLPYPLGLNGNLGQIDFSFPFLLSYHKKGQYQFTLGYYTDISINLFDFNSDSIDIDPPSLRIFRASPFGTNSILIQLEITDDVSGFYSLNTIDTDFDLEITYRDLVAGDLTNGLYEKVIECPTNRYTDVFKFSMQDMVGNLITLNSMMPTELMEPIPYIPYPIRFSIDNVQSFSFKDRSLDVTNLIAQSSVYFTLDTVIPDLKPKLTFVLAKFNSEKSKVKSFTGFWDSINNRYQIDFIIPPNYIDGEIDYYLESNPSIPKDFFVAKFFSNAKLLIISKNVDFQPPKITKIELLSGGLIGWDVTIADSINGLKEAHFNVTSNLDLLPYIFKFTPSMSIGGDAYNGVYRIVLSISTDQCVSQIFSFHESIRLIDGAENIAESLMLNQNTLFDPLDQISIDSAQLYYYFTCPNPIEDTTMPRADFTPTMRDDYLNLTVKAIDLESGLSERHNPILCFSSLYSFTTIPFGDPYFRNRTHASYKLTAPIPNELVLQDFPIVVSVYGIMNNNLLVYGGRVFSTVPAPKKVFPLAITNVTSITKMGGYITIDGTGFTNNSNMEAFISYNFTRSDSVQNIYTSFTKAILILPPFTTTFVDLFVRTINSTSNYYRIIPIDTPTSTPNTPTPTQATCPGSPQCSNNGKCNQGKCECNSGWIGPSCSLKLIDVNTNVDPNKPTTTISGKDNLLNSFIQIASLYELDQNKDIIQQYDLKDKWSFENQTTPDSTIYIFSRLLSSDRTTRINITLQYFDKDSIYSFGNQNFTMNKSSMKYSIILGSYQFGNQLNTLQLVMNATLSTKDSNGCIRSDFSSDSDVEYLKVQINENTLFARFINFGIFDFRVKSLTNQILNKTSESRGSISTSLIGINIPYYEMSALLDPDFSVLVDQNADVCSSKSGLTTAQIIGIAVGGAVFLIFASILVVIVIKRRYSIHFGKGINMVKLESTNK